MDASTEMIASVTSSSTKENPACRRMPVFLLLDDAHRMRLRQRDRDGAAAGGDGCCRDDPELGLRLAAAGPKHDRHKRVFAFCAACRTGRSHEYPAVRAIDVMGEARLLAALLEKGTFLHRYDFERRR